MQIDKILKKAEKLFEQEEYNDVIELILDIPEDKRGERAWDLLALSYYGLSVYDYALQVLESYTPKPENLGYWYYRRGIVNYSMEHFDVATDLFLQCLKTNCSQEIKDSSSKYLKQMVDDIGQCYNEMNAPIRYCSEDMEALKNHIEKYFGEISFIMQEKFSPDIHCDVLVIEPTKQRNFYTLVTMGMGAFLMNVPDELCDENLERAEIMIMLPPDWKVLSSEGQWYWPIELIKRVARLPFRDDVWLGLGHSIDSGAIYDESTSYCGCVLDFPVPLKGFDVTESSRCRLDDKSDINIYLAVPIYYNELKAKLKFGVSKLFELLSRYQYKIVDPDRDDSCEYLDENGIDLSQPMDSGNFHSAKVEKNSFPLDPIVGYNHLAIYLRWCIENDLMSRLFIRKHSDVISGVKSGETVDLREFIRDSFNGELIYDMFNDEGLNLARYYYSAYNGGNEKPYFPADIDDYAEKYFGTEKYNCEEFNDEAYLFVPFDEDFYKAMKKYIEKAFEEMKNKNF